MSKTVLAVSEIAAGAALALTGFGVIALPWALSAGVLSAMGAVGVTAGITGIFGLLQPLLNPNDLSIPGSQQNAQDSASFRRVIYGVMEVGGVLTFDSAPAGNQTYQNHNPTENWRHQVYTLAAHEITAFGRGGAPCVLIDNVLTELFLDPGGSGYYGAIDDTMPYGGIDGLHALFEFDLGNPASSSAFPALASACPDWTASCIQKGRAKVHVAMRYDTTADGTSLGNGGSTYTPDLQTSVPIYVNGRVPTFRFPVIGVPIVDTRTGLPAVNPSNPALIVYDYLTNKDYGLGCNPASIDVPSVNAAANICEEQVVVYIASTAGSVSENLYACNGVFDYSAARGDVLKSLIGSMAGTVIPPGDFWHVFAGAYNAPSFTLTDADMRDSIKGDFRISRRDICNGVKGTFIPAFLPTNQTQAQPAAWRWTDFPPYQGNGLLGHPNYLAEDGGQIIWKEARFGFTTSIWMVQRLAKIVLQQLRFQVTLHLACKLTAFPIQAGDTITFIHARWAALTPAPPTTFFVTQATLIVENTSGVPTLGVDLVLRQHDPSIYAFTAPSSPGNQGEYSAYGTLGTM